MKQRLFIELLAQEGLCRDKDPDLWFPEFDERTKEYGQQAAKAIAVCDVCPIKEVCLAYGLEFEDYGVWGGTTPSQRREMRKHESTN